MPCGFRSQPDRPLSRADFQETRGLGSTQVRCQQVLDVRIPERVEPQHGDVFARGHHPQALLIAPEPVGGAARKPEPGPAERLESSPNLVERGPRVAAPSPDLVEPVNEECLPRPLCRAGLGKHQEVAGRKADRVVSERFCLPLELGGLSRSRIAEQDERARVAEGGERLGAIFAGRGDGAGYPALHSGATQCPAG